MPLSLLATTFAKFARARQIAGNTPQSTITNLEEERASRYQPAPHEDYDVVYERKLDAGAEGEVSVKRSRANGKLFVVKHSHAVRIDQLNRHKSDGTRAFKVPCDADFAKNLIPAHPNIVVVHAMYEDQYAPGRFYIYMEFCAGGDLNGQISFWNVHRNVPTPRLFLYHIVVQMFEILAYIHHGLRHDHDGIYTQDKNHQAVVHGDLKPEQFFLSWSAGKLVGGMPTLVLGDFGHAKLLNDPNPRAGAGTIGWLAPEQQALCDLWQSARIGWFDVGAKSTPASDIYSAGQVLYYVAVQQSIREDRTWRTGANEELLNLSMEHGLRDIIYGCLRVNPSKRASACFEERHNGILDTVSRMRKARDNLILRGDNLEDPTNWAYPPR